MNKPIYIICGKSGVGKTTLINNLCLRNNLKTLISYTTRPKRTSSENTHIFVSDDEFDCIQNKFLEFSFLNYRYCITRDQILNADILGLPPNAFHDLGEKKSLLYREIKLIYVMTSEKTRYERMIHRNDSIENITIRMSGEIEYFDDIEKHADKKVYNYDLEECLEEIERYMDEEL